ncbi:MAG: endo alpha-1,4 polygalactosaminidase, partial [Bacteroidales bacterium]|nr:endo alpha-1,4 polygalactosaminidase [Bacteroidales bacterium]
MQHIFRFISLVPVVLLAVACNRPNVEPCNDYRKAMRDFVIRISEMARTQDADFVVIPQNGIELVTMGDDAHSELAAAYLSAIDGHGQEDLFYGYSRDDKPTPSDATEYLLSYLRRSQQTGNRILVTDYCSRPDYVADARSRCDVEGFASFAAPSRELDVIPTGAPTHENAQDIVRLSEAQNFLYLLNNEQFNSKNQFIESIAATNYDVVIMDLFFNDETAFTAVDVERLKHKANGSKRLVICYMSIGEAEDYRYYWQSSWKRHKPAWLARENPSWPGNYKVCYWCSEWQDLICGDGDSYLNRILSAGFDGVYLDIVDAFEYF